MINFVKRFLLLVTVCVTANAQQAVTIDQFAIDGPAFLTNKSLQAIYGLADEYSEEIKRVEVMPSRKTIKLHTVYFDGLQIYGFARSETEFVPLTITITNAHWRIAYELNVGSAIEQVQKMLGEPNEINDHGFIYQANAGEVLFQYLDGVVTKVTFNYHADY